MLRRARVFELRLRKSLTSPVPTAAAISHSWVAELPKLVRVQGLNLESSKNTEWKDIKKT
jgi:hypothetical protein